MDRRTHETVSRGQRPGVFEKRITRREAIKYGLVGLAGAAGVGSLGTYVVRQARRQWAPGVFKGDAPDEALWALWKRRGWTREALHYLKLGRNVQCKLCPNECVLEPEDRSRCRNKVNKGGTLYTLAYGDPCTFHVDPIEKKPLFHFLPATGVFSIATSGCGFRCLNCQNWEISQSKPEETKDARGETVKLDPSRPRLTRQDLARLSMFPADVVQIAQVANCPSIAYTYSEPTAYYEYMYDTARLAHEKGIRNVWVTCGYIHRQPLVELCDYLDAANVDLKSFDDRIYRKLNSGTLQPILDTLLTLKDRGVWFEVTNLIVPTYTDDMEMIRRMCGWLVENLGPDYPLHFSRFHPAHKLAHLPPTPVNVLVEARDIAIKAGLHYVYIGNVRGVEDAETTFCPVCKRAVIERTLFFVRSVHVKAGACEFCGAKIAGVWAA